MQSDSAPVSSTVEQLVETFDGFLIDAYGVLVHSGGAYAGASAFIERLDRRGVPYRVVTNDASRLPSTCAEKYRSHGIAVPDDQVVTSGSMLTPYFESNGLDGAPCLCLGTSDSHAYVNRAGGRLVDADVPFDVLVMGDDAGFPFRKTVDQALTHLFHRFDADDPVDLLLPNPDQFFQRSTEDYGVAIGAIAAMFESILEDRYPDRAPTFERLGKPNPTMFRHAARRVAQELPQVSNPDILMIGDQLNTDIRGAEEAGLKSALMTSSHKRWAEASRASGVTPDYLLDGLET
jgi:HAD superfamily hydrolase (TIGR01450 family)